MSFSSRLPPRSPIQNRGLALGLTFQTAPRDDYLCIEHCRFPFQGSFSEEETSWLDDLLINSKTNATANSLRRASSDPIALLEDSSSFHSPTYLDCEGNARSSTEGDEIDCCFEAACIYGPNSPRNKNELTYSESMTVTALLENVTENPYKHLSGEYFDNIQNSSCSHIPRKSRRRRSRQRSRVRRLQYIAELERTANAYEVIGAELAGSVASALQQRIIISSENKKLEQQILTLQRQNMIKEAQICCHCKLQARFFTCNKEGPLEERQLYGCPRYSNGCSLLLTKEEVDASRSNSQLSNVVEAKVRGHEAVLEQMLKKL